VPFRARTFNLANILRRRPPQTIGTGTQSVDRLKSQLESGLAKANRYRLILPRDFGIDTESLDILCDTVSIPGRQITTNEYYTSMRATQIAYAFGVAPLTVGFYLTNNWEAWNYINEWQKTVVDGLDFVTGYRLNFKQQYQKQIIIEHLDSEDQVRKRITVLNAFPTTLSEVELGNANSDITRVTATFAYDNWTDIT
jgi:hypothetical protein